MCPVNSCTSTFECSADLDSHIAANFHDIPAPKPRTSNDIARLHLVETLRTANIQSQQGASTIRTTQNTLGIDMSGSTHYEFVSSPGWALRVRKNNNPLTENIKAFIEDMRVLVIWSVNGPKRPCKKPFSVHPFLSVDGPSSESRYLSVNDHLRAVMFDLGNEQLWIRRRWMVYKRMRCWEPRCRSAISSSTMNLK